MIHLEADLHATADNVHGHPDSAWVGHPAIDCTVKKPGTDWEGERNAASDASQRRAALRHNVQMDGPGQHKVTYRVASPDEGFLRHLGQETGVPALVGAVQRHVRLRLSAVVEPDIQHWRAMGQPADRD